jgi:hypothetical protein
LDDDGARQWLQDNQRAGGGWFVGPESLGSDAATPYAALALEGLPAAEVAVDYLVAHPAAYVDPEDPDNRGWGWTYGTYTWVDPTARALIALRRLQPGESAIARGRLALSRRECVGGGWNYGSPEVMGKELEPYLATTALAVIALHGVVDPILERGVAVIKRLWDEEDGLLSGAIGMAALRLTGEDTAGMDGPLVQRASTADSNQDVVALAWAAIALGRGIGRLRVRS